MTKNFAQGEDFGVEGAIWVRLPSMLMPRIAEIDRAILAALRANGRISYVDLAKEVGASERTVRTHVRKLEEDGTWLHHPRGGRRFDGAGSHQGRPGC